MNNDPVLKSEKITRFQKPGMWKDVVTPALVIWIILFVFAIGVGIMRRDDGKLIVAYGLVTASSVSFVVIFWLLTVYNRDRAQVRTIREYYEEPEPESPARIMVQKNGAENGNGRTWTIGQYAWTIPRQQALAQRLYNGRGEWVGELRFTRATVEGVILNVTQNYPVVVRDFKNAGWITDDVDQHWTHVGRNMVRQSLFIAR